MNTPFTILLLDEEIKKHEYCLSQSGNWDDYNSELLKTAIENKRKEHREKIEILTKERDYLKQLNQQ